MLLALLLFSSIQLPQAHAKTEQVFENSQGSPLMSLLSNAKKSIDIEIYEMDDPMVMGILKTALKNKIKIRVVKEGTPVGNTCNVFDDSVRASSPSCTQQRELMRMIKSAGGKYVPFNHATLCGKPGTTCFEHGKLVIIDGNQALMSTGNFNSTSLCNRPENPKHCDRDYSVVTDDAQVLSELQQIFEKDLVGSAYDLPSVMHAGTPRLTVSPYSLDPIVAMIEGAKKSLLIQNQYLKEPTYNQAIIDAAKRGVHVEVMVASACSFGKPKASDVSQWTKIYSAFDQAGISTRIFTGSIEINGVPGYLHAKVIVADGNLAWVGSVNGSATSLSNNREYGIFFTDLGQVQKLTDWLSSDFSAQGSETWKESLQCLKDPASGQE